MSKNKVKSRDKSGLLSGLVMVSVGLIAGYHGFNKVTTAEADSVIGADMMGLTMAPKARTKQAMNEQISDLDEMVTAALDKNLVASSAGKKTSQPGTQKIAMMLRVKKVKATTITPGTTRFLANPEPVRSAQPKQVAIPPAPKSNLWVHADETNAVGDIPATDVNSLLEENITIDIGSEADGFDAEEQEIAAGMDVPQSAKYAQAPIARTPVKKVVAHYELPLADSADVALFAADMPLPANLTSYQTPVTTRAALITLDNTTNKAIASPLSPRKFSTGKSFGGLGEKEFQKRERRCMVTALYFEARSESDAGQIAVGQVVMNRVKSPDYPDTICGVVYQGSRRRTGCQFSFTCDGKVDRPNNKAMWERSKRLADDVLTGRSWLKSINNSTHYHATYVTPRWRRKMSRLAKIGRHIFYKSPNISVTATYQRVAGKRS